MGLQNGLSKGPLHDLPEGDKLIGSLDVGNEPALRSPDSVPCFASLCYLLRCPSLFPFWPPRRCSQGRQVPLSAAIAARF